MPALKSIASATFLAFSVLSGLNTHRVEAAPAPQMEKRLLLPLAPLASDIDGAHLIMNNDADTQPLIKNSFMLLSKPRTYYNGMSACLSMGDGGVIYIPGTNTATELVQLLNSNAPAQEEVSGFSQFWVFNGVPGIFGNCLAVNKNSGKTDWIPCSTQLPAVCNNSVMRRVLVFQDATRQVKVDTPVGQVQGWRDQNAFRFLGIPFAEPPTGERRFAKPVAKAPFSGGTFDATRFGNACPQASLKSGFVSLVTSLASNGVLENEDCLYLNVFTPSLKGQGLAKLPVMVYIHGGGFTTFSGSVIIFEPGNLVARGGVVVVTLNYRLGLLGFMENNSAWPQSSIPGNQAIHDQIMALQWVQKNIAAFGGDPNRVTLFAESAGAVSVRALLSAPSAFGLYKNVIATSDPINIPFSTPAIASNLTNYFMEALHCSPTDLVCARSKSVEDVLNAQTDAQARALKDNKWTTSALVTRPTVDGSLIPADFDDLVKTGQYNTKATIMWGSTKDEAGRFVPWYFPDVVPPANMSEAYQNVVTKAEADLLLSNPTFVPNPSDEDAVRNLFAKMGTEYFFLCPLRYLSREMTPFKPTYNFIFNRGHAIPIADATGFCADSTGRVCHAADIQPTFGSASALPGVAQTGDDARFARQVMDRFTTFAKTGNPNPQPGQTGFEINNPDVAGLHWPTYDDSNPILELNVKSTVSINKDALACDWLDVIFKYKFM